MDSPDLEALKAGNSSGIQARKQARHPENSVFCVRPSLNVTSLVEKTLLVVLGKHSQNKRLIRESEIPVQSRNTSCPAWLFGD